jgi:DNA-binding CsgD family transcriptional regulator
MLELTASEIEKITQAIQLLISPLDYSSVDEWRLAVNRQLKEILRADSVGFLLPVDDALPLFSEEHDPVELARYQDYPPPPLVDGTPLWARLAEARVGSLAEIYGANYHLYLDSTYYQEYAGANGAHDTLTAAAPLGGTDAHSMAILHFWHASPTGPLFTERDSAIVKLIYPAFRAGAETQMRWGTYRNELFRALDRLGQAVLVFDRNGRQVHQTGAVVTLLERDPHRDVIFNEVRAIVNARGLSACVQVQTALARYELRASSYAEDSSAGPMMLVAVDRKSAVLLSEQEMRALYGLTRAEVRVAHLIGRALSNADVAQTLSISPHTARRHTERVLMKLGVRSRAEVAAKLLS